LHEYAEETTYLDKNVGLGKLEVFNFDEGPCTKFGLKRDTDVQMPEASRAT
jgi:hypothetical protein